MARSTLESVETRLREIATHIEADTKDIEEGSGLSLDDSIYYVREIRWVADELCTVRGRLADNTG